MSTAIKSTPARTSPSTRSSQSADAHRRADAQPAAWSFAGIGILNGLLDVFDGDQPLEFEIVVDDEQLFDAMVVQQFFGCLEIDARFDRHQIILGHHLGDRRSRRLLETQIAIGQNADQLAVLSHRQT